MLDVFRQIVANWAAIWSTPSAEAFWALYTAYAIGTFFLCLPVYMIVGATWMFDIKSKAVAKLTSAVLNWTIALNLALAVAPVGIPVFLLVVLVRAVWRYYNPPRARRANRSRNRREREPEEEEDD